MTWYHIILDAVLVAALVYQAWVIERLQLETRAYKHQEDQ